MFQEENLIFKNKTNKNIFRGSFHMQASTILKLLWNTIFILLINEFVLWVSILPEARPHK
jgi:hypothetical protein